MICICYCYTYACLYICYYTHMCEYHAIIRTCTSGTVACVRIPIDCTVDIPPPGQSVYVYVHESCICICMCYPPLWAWLHKTSRPRLPS